MRDRHYAELETVLGTLSFVCDDAGRLVELGFGRRNGPATGSDACEGVARQLTEYIAGERRRFDLELAPAGTAFQRRVWRELGRIPYGQVVSYGELARRIGKPGAARAVGQANGANPIPIVVPCHRVIAADGTIGGFSSGLTLKRRLLALEQIELAA